jgi:hypothetical protein
MLVLYEIGIIRMFVSILSKTGIKYKSKKYAARETGTLTGCVIITFIFEDKLLYQTGPYLLLLLPDL